MTTKKQLLWVGDAACDSGFSKATHYTLDVLRRYWDIHVLGINYRGEPHRYPYDIYPCFLGGDLFGVGRLKELTEKIKPDVIVLQNDVWNIPAYTQTVSGPHYVGALAVDGLNCRGDLLNDLSLAIFWTKFGHQEAIRGGLQKPGVSIPLGLDLDFFRPQDKIESRRSWGLSGTHKNDFIIGNVNRNQPRKRLDLTIKTFAMFIERHRLNDAWLFLHVAPTGDSGIDCAQLAKYYGVEHRLILSEPGVFKGIAEDRLASLYSCFDIQLSTTQGEGWGLTTMEGMACGVPQIVPAWAALGEWTAGAALQVPCSHTNVTPDNINSIGGIPDEERVVDALYDLYSQPELRQEMRASGLQLAHRPEYRWENIGKQFAAAIAQHVYVADETKVMVNA